MTIGKRIKSRRKSLGISAEQLAEEIGRSPATVYRYENGDIRSIDAAIIEPMAVALRTTPEYLMGWDAKTYRSNSDYQRGPFSDRLAVVMALRRLDREQLSDMIGMPDEDVESIMSDPEPPDEAITQKLSIILAVNEQWLTGQALEPVLYLDDTEYDIIRCYRKASEDTKKAIRAFIAAVK